MPRVWRRDFAGIIQGSAGSKPLRDGSAEHMPQILVWVTAGQVDTDPATTHGDPRRYLQNVKAQGVDLRIAEPAGVRDQCLEQIE